MKQSKRYFSGIPLLSLWSSDCWQFDFWFLFLSKPSLDIWKFLVCITLKPPMENFKRDLTSMRDVFNCLMVSTSLVLPFLGTEMRIDLFQSCGHCWVFQTCWHIECNTLMASTFKVLNSSAGILLHPLALLTAVLPKAHLTSSPKCVALGAWPHHHGNPVH